jgi:hypothetical protein
MIALNWLFVPRVAFQGKGRPRVQFDLVQQTLAFVSKHVPIERGRPIFWLERGPSTDYVSSLASTHLFLYSLAGVAYPMLPDDVTKFPRAGATIQSGSTVVIVSYRDPEQAAVEREFERFGLTARTSAREQIHAGGVSLQLSAVDVGKP